MRAAVAAIAALAALLVLATYNAEASIRARGREVWIVSGPSPDAEPNPDANADAACCDASLEGYLSVEAVGFEAVGY